MKEVNKQLHNLFAKLSSFPRATLKHLKCCVVPSLIDKLIAKIANEIWWCYIMVMVLMISSYQLWFAEEVKFFNEKVKRINLLLKIHF